MDQGSESMYVVETLERGRPSHDVLRRPEQLPSRMPVDDYDGVLNLIISEQVAQICNSSTSSKAFKSFPSLPVETPPRGVVRPLAHGTLHIALTVRQFIPMGPISKVSFTGDGGFDGLSITLRSLSDDTQEYQDAALDKSILTSQRCLACFYGSRVSMVNIGQALVRRLQNARIMPASIFGDLPGSEIHRLFSGMMSCVCSYQQGALFRLPSKICSPKLVMAIVVPSLFGGAGAVPQHPPLFDTSSSPFMDVKNAMRLLPGTAVLVGSAEYAVAEANRKQKSKSGIRFFLAGLVLMSFLGLFDSNLDLRSALDSSLLNPY